MSDEGLDRGELDRLFRSIALEVLIVDLMANCYLNTSDPVATAAAHRDHMRDTWSQIAAPFLRDPGDSELIIGGVGDAIDRLMQMASNAVARMVNERQRRS